MPSGRKSGAALFLHLLVGVLYVVVGFMVLANPEASAVTLTLIMAIFFILDGIFRIIIAVSHALSPVGLGCSLTALLP